MNMSILRGDDRYVDIEAGAGFSPDSLGFQVEKYVLRKTSALQNSKIFTRQKKICWKMQKKYLMNIRNRVRCLKIKNMKILLIKRLIIS